MAHEVTMPQLGMAQDSGIIVAWHKAPGDKVAKGEILFEVETDKAVMEVEAAAAGVLLELRRAEGEDVPVGEVLAVIGAEGEAVKAAPAKAEAKAEAPKAEAVAAAAPSAAPAPVFAPEPAPAPAPAAAPAAAATAAPAAGGKVLASPKARALAAEQGLDLNRLAAAGHPQPYRVADLELLKAMPAAAAAAATGGAPAAALARARVPAAAFDGFLGWVGGEAKADAGAVLAAFAAGAFRAATGAGSVTVRLSAPREATVIYADPDRAGIGRMTAAEGGAPDLIVHDLTRTRLAHVELGATAAPTLSVAREGDVIVATLAVAAGTLDDDAVIACLDGFAGRIDEPLRQLL
jgi:pyruvate/2-oxoglutarate dehydrogenase complex dihydrolipoamide acyltransferase (E2) component